jgi:hypothetical protein
MFMDMLSDSIILSGDEDGKLEKITPASAGVIGLLQETGEDDGDSYTD